MGRGIVVVFNLYYKLFVINILYLILLKQVMLYQKLAVVLQQMRL